MKKQISTIVILTIAFSLNAQSPWTLKSNMPAGRFGHSSILLDGKIYLMGGSNNTSSAFSTMIAYDPILDTWTPKADMDTGRINLVTCIVNDKILAFGGGRDFYRSPLYSVEEYDPVSDTWVYKTNMSVARNGLTATLLDGKIYIIGGGDSNLEPIAETEVYDPIANTWSSFADLPTPRTMLAAVTLDGKIYAIGGMLGQSGDEIGLTTLEVYDPITDTWTTKASMNTPRKFVSASVFDGKIYVFGGTEGFCQPSLSSGEVYDPVTDTWAEISTIPAGLCIYSLTEVNGKVYIIGGVSQIICPSSPVSTIYEYDPSIDLRPDIAKFGIDKSYANPGTDSVLITTELKDSTWNTLYAYLEAPDETLHDSLQLFDDGNHWDGNAGDKIYANSWPVSPAVEQYFYIDLHAARIETDTIIRYMNNMALFTTVGPVVFEKYSFAGNDTIPNPDDLMRTYITLKNNGEISETKTIMAKLISLDPLVEIAQEENFFPNIVAGEVMQSNNYYRIDIPANFPHDTEIPLELEISSRGYTYWKDTFSIMVQAPDNIDDLEETIVRIYPNPATDQLTIEFDNSTSPVTSLVLYDLTGKVVYSEKLDQRVSSQPYNINLSSLGEGLYFINISNDQYSYTEKVIKVE